MHKPSHSCAQPFLGFLWVCFTSKWIRLSLLSLWKSPAINLRLFLKRSICDPYLVHISAFWKKCNQKKGCSSPLKVPRCPAEDKLSKLEIQTNQNPRQKKKNKTKKSHFNSAALVGSAIISNAEMHLDISVCSGVANFCPSLCWTEIQCYNYSNILRISPNACIDKISLWY